MFSDIHTRWSKWYRTVTARNVAAPYMDTDIITSAHEANQVTREEVIRKQQKSQKPKGVHKNHEGLYGKGQKVWILDSSFVL